VVIDSFLGLVHIEACTAVDVGDDTDSGVIHHIGIEVDTLVLVLAIDFDSDPVDDEQLAKAMNLVELVILLLQGELDTEVWKKC